MICVCVVCGWCDCDLFVCLGDYVVGVGFWVCGVLWLDVDCDCCGVEVVECVGDGDLYIFVFL